MIRNLISLSLAVAILAACGNGRGSGLNPFNWFQSEPEVETLVPLDEEVIVDPRQPIAQIAAVRVDPLTDGIILRAVGIAATQGYWEADLVADSTTPVNGVLTFRFLVAPPLDPGTRVGSQRSRQVQTAIFISNQSLAGVRGFRVVGRQNIQTARR